MSGLLGVALVAFVVLSYLPGQRERRGVEMQIHAGERELASNMTHVQTLDVVREEVARLQTRLERVGKRLPRQQDLGQFIKDITALSQQASLRKLSHQPSPNPRRDPLYSELPISLAFEGAYPDVSRFLR